MLPPRHVYSAVINNNSDKEITVTATYEMPSGSDSETIVVAAGSQSKFGEKTVESGTATLIGNITDIEVKGGAVVKGPFVASPTRDFVFTVANDLTIAF